jgi:16S rRNA (uracil1498-N3)-methyltransferase
VHEQLRRSSAHVLVDDVEGPLLDADTEHHLFRVLRLRDGEAVTVTDGAGAWRSCRVVGTTIEPDGPLERVAAPLRPTTVAVAVPKHDRPDWLVQKLTELGIDHVILLHAERSVVRWSGERAERRVDKLRKVAAEAAMQSRRVWMPTVTGPVAATGVLPQVAAAEPGGRALESSDHAVAIGPEGGWAPAELALASDLVGLGGTVLRVETAALAAAVLLSAHRE